MKYNLYFTIAATIILCSIVYNNVYAQDKIYTLNALIIRAQEKSLNKKIAQNTAMSGYWTYNSFKASLYPKISLNGTVPSYNRTIDKITIPTGEDVFVPRNQSYADIGLNVSQNIAPTGGVLSLYSSLRRIDVFSPFNSKQYSSIPFTLSYSQNTLLYNPFKWQKKIAPLELEETQKNYVESLENIALNATDYFFAYLIAQNQLEIDKQNMLNADTLLKITREKFSIGTRDNNDLLQARLNLLNSHNNIIKDQITFEQAKQSFVQFFRFNNSDSIILSIPDETTFFEVNSMVALEKAQKNRKKVVEFRRRRMQAEQNLQSAKANAAPNIGIYANLGVSQTNEDLIKTYHDLQRQHSLALQINIPIIDWGVNRSRIKKAQSDLDLTNASIEQENESFEQEISFQTMQWNSMQAQLSAATDTKQIAMERYAIAKQRYVLGTINFTEFNNAQQQKDAAINDYLYSIKAYWSAYHQMRKLTLYDFKNNVLIKYEISDLK